MSLFQLDFQMIIEIDEKMTLETIRDKIQQATHETNEQWQEEKEKALNAIFNSKTFDQDPLIIQKRMRK